MPRGNKGFNGRAAAGWRTPWGKSGGGFAFGELPAGADPVAGVAVGDALQVVLVLGLGLPERAGRLQLGHDLAGPQAGRVDVLDGVLGDALLLVGSVEDGRAIGAAAVVALPV